MKFGDQREYGVLAADVLGQILSTIMAKVQKELVKAQAMGILSD
jgi:hypothetical protein